MSTVIAKRLLETRFNSISPGINIAFPNVKYNPIAGTPWERVDFLLAETENPTMGSAFKRDVGLMQILLHYPLHAGAGAALTRAEAIRAGFVRGLSLTEGTLRVLIHRSPWVSELPSDPTWFRVAVSVPYIVDIHG